MRVVTDEEAHSQHQQALMSISRMKASSGQGLAPEQSREGVASRVRASLAQGFLGGAQSAELLSKQRRSSSKGEASGPTTAEPKLLKSSDQSKCTKCEKRLMPGAAFCSKCGTPAKLPERSKDEIRSTAEEVFPNIELEMKKIQVWARARGYAA